MSQFAFDLPHGNALGRGDFFVSESNKRALEWIERWPDWPGGVLLLHGPRGCGKTHLAHIWRDRSAAEILGGTTIEEAEVPLAAAAPGLAVDDAERAPEVALLHLFNTCRERRISLLLVAGAAPAVWPIELPDLASRLRGALSVGIDPPDDALLGAVLVKQFADRQLIVGPEVIRYVLRRMERSFAAAAAIAAALDRLAMSRGGPVTIPLARAVLDRPAVQSSLPPSDFGVA